jgi:hypothetical protein
MSSFDRIEQCGVVYVIVIDTAAVDRAAQIRSAQ